ncbi:MAG: FAD-dependent oxidoreductase [Ruminococcaceae bacterium]|nr:FAD-dependent oxidoreductase [Oscillospiraceae bacterium]
MTDVLIIGAGPAGLTAAIYAARAGLTALVLDKNMYGGQIALTSEVDNYPGLQGIEGVEFATKLYSHAISQGAEVRFEAVTAMELDGPVKRVTTSEKVYEARTVILATGAARRRLDVPGEEKYTGRGVSYCATCDAAFFRQKRVAIVGGGDTALSDALFLSNQCEKVTLIHRRDIFRAQKVKMQAVRARENIEIITHATVRAIEGGDTVERCVINTPDGERIIPIDGIFVAVGVVPESDLLTGMLPLDIHGYAEVDETCETPLPGVYLAGDLRKKPLRQIVTAAADGAVAAVAAAEYCSAMDEQLPVEELSPAASDEDA